MRHQERRGLGQGRRTVACFRIKTLAEKFELHLGMMAPRTEEDRLPGSGDQRRAPSQRGGRERAGEITAPNLVLREGKGSGGGRRKTQSPERPPQSHPASLSGSSYTHKRKANGHQSRTCSQVASTEKNMWPWMELSWRLPTCPKEKAGPSCPNSEPEICQAKEVEATRVAESPGLPLRHLGLLGYQERRSGSRCLSCPVGAAR